MQSTAQQWLVYRITGSQLSLGAVTFIGFLPVLLLSLPMGVLADRFPRRKILIFTQSWFMLLAGVLAFVTFAGIVRYEHILLLAFLLGIVNALDMPTRQAFYMDMVQREDLLNAIALNSSVFNGARIIGPALGGLIVGLFGEAPAFTFNSVSYMAVILALLIMRLPPHPSSGKREGGWAEMKHGLKFLVEERRVFGLVAMIALLSFFGAPYLVLLPAFARGVLNVGAGGFGLLMAAQGVGALTSALLLAASGERRHKGRLLWFSRASLAIALLILGLSRDSISAILALMLAGYSLITQLAVTNTLIQLIIPDEIRGRVLSAFTWALGGFWPLGSLMLGALGDWLGTSQAVLIAAGCIALLSIASGRLFPEMHELE